MISNLRIATRSSPLAIWQAEEVIRRLQLVQKDLKFELIRIKTEGDKLLDRPLFDIGGKGLFIKELEQALINNKADIAIHSMKDVPAVLPNKLEIGAVLKRENPCDVLISNKYTSMGDMPAKSIVGTSSLRRKFQLKHAFPNLIYRDLRGNIHTRLQKLDDGKYDAIILAYAGIKRLGLEDRITLNINIDTCVPAIGQGIIGIESKKENTKINNLLSRIEDIETKHCMLAERSISHALSASCELPLAAYASITKKNNIYIKAIVADIDGAKIIMSEITGSENKAVELGEAVANDLKSKGAENILLKIKANNEK
jgi:hydroxymethylbilane synthase